MSSFQAYCLTILLTTIGIVDLYKLTTFTMRLITYLQEHSSTGGTEHNPLLGLLGAPITLWIFGS